MQLHWTFWDHPCYGNICGSCLGWLEANDTMAITQVVTIFLFASVIVLLPLPQILCQEDAQLSRPGLTQISMWHSPLPHSPKLLFVWEPVSPSLPCAIQNHGGPVYPWIQAQNMREVLSAKLWWAQSPQCALSCAVLCLAALFLMKSLFCLRVIC